MPFPLPQDEELARQLQLELNAMSDVQERGEGVTVPLHGDLQSTLTVSHLTWEYMYNHRQRKITTTGGYATKLFDL